MTLRGKKLFVGAILLAVTVWPAAHRLLVARYDMSPWKFFGWAMYCRPPSQISVVIDRPGMNSGDPPSTFTAPVDWDVRISRFLRWRKHAGSIVRPDRLARIVFAQNPDVSEVTIGVTHTRLTWGGMVESWQYEYAYDRSDLVPP